VVADVLDEGFGIALVVEQVIDQLEGDTQVVAKLAQRLALLVAGAGQGGGAMGGGLEQHGGLAANDLHIDFFSGAGVANLRQLQHFAFGDHSGGLGDDAHDRHRAQGDHHFEGACIKEVAYQHARRVAPQGVGGGATTAHAGHVDHVVMQQGGGVQEFDDGGQQSQLIALEAERVAAEQYQQRAQALAAGGGDVVPDLFNQRYAG